MTDSPRDIPWGQSAGLSVLMGRDHEAIDALLRIHAVSNPVILDATFNHGVMWEKCNTFPSITMDIADLSTLSTRGDFSQMPFRGRSFDVVVFDPPHLPTHAASKNSSRIFERRYGITDTGNGRTGDNVSGMFPGFLVEAKRVLRPNGIVLAKLVDIVHNHHYQWQQVDFINCCREIGLTPCDMLIKRDPNAGNLTSGKWQNAKHLRRAHAYWIVARNGRCERP